MKPLNQGDDSSPQRVDDLTGMVVKAPFGGSSKSARIALWLETAERRLVLRRKEGPTFGDHALDKYEGKRVSCDGFVVGYTLLAEKIQIVK